jgi:deoxyribose-phosphate aldolase
MSRIDHDLARMIDHALLKAEATANDIKWLCEEAKQCGFASVCVNSSHVPFCAGILDGSSVRICSVVGFPLGAMATEVKAAEAAWAIRHGADEIDMVMAIGHLLSGEILYVGHDIEAVVQAAEGRVVKVILETGLLDGAEIVAACDVATAYGAQFVKTSTGFGPRGATVEDVRLMRGVVGMTKDGIKLGVKASGGIRDRATALAMIEAGATRLGASASVSLVMLDS